MASSTVILLAALALAAGEPGVSNTLAVTLVPDPLPVGLGELRGEDVLAGLAARLAPSGMHVVPSTPASAMGAWRLRLGQMTSGIEVVLEEPSGALVFQREVVSAELGPSEVAHRVAVLVADGLSPWFEELLGELSGMPVPRRAPTPAQPPVPVPAPVAEPTTVQRRWLGALVLAGLAWPRGDAQLAGGLAYEQDLGALRIAGSLSTALPNTTRGDDYRLRLWSSWLRPRIGLARQWGSWELAVLAGPSLRFARATSAGERIADRAQSFFAVAPGVDGQVAVDLAADVRLRVGVTVERFFPHQRFTADAREVARLGGLQLSASVGVMVRL